MTVKISGNSSASTPSFAGDDGDSGLHATADQVQLVTNGTVAVTVDSSQNVGIGKTSSGNKLEIEGQGNTKVVIDGRTDAANGSDAVLELWSKNSSGTNNFGFIDYDGDGNFEIGSGGSGAGSVPLVFKTNNAERMRISSAGEVKIGGNISQGYGQAFGYMLAVQGPASAAQTYISIPAPGQTADSQGLIIGTDGGTSYFWQRDFKNLIFGVGNTERMRLSYDGICQIRTQSNNGFVCASQQGSGSSNFLFQGGHSSTGVGSYTPSFRVDTAGNIYSTNTSITGISDINLKENVVDAKSQWDDIKNLHLVNYNFKAETGHLTHKQLGLIAQEVEQICPSVVQDITDESTGEVTKGVAYSLIWMKAVKALQEAMDRIETLEAINAEQATTIASFEARISALEGGN